MTTSYSGDSLAQKRRRQMILAVRHVLGDEAFADFITDLLAGGYIADNALPALAHTWLQNRDRRAAPSP
jgi:hypothetical protein